MLDSDTRAAMIWAIASRQHGIIDFDGLEAAGVPRSTVALWARTGRLHRLHLGVYSLVPPALLSVEGRWLAVVRACGRGAALSHTPAGQLAWLVPREASTAMHVSLSDRRRLQPPGIVVHRPTELPPCDRTMRSAIPTTTPTRIVWDLSAVASPSVVRRAYEKAQGRDQLDHARLERLRDSCPAHRGSGLIGELLRSRPLPLQAVRTWLEGLLLHVCSEHSVPLPAVNVPLLGYEVDFLWERARFVVEADGGDHLGPAQRDRDNSRDATLGRAGYLVRRYSSRAMDRGSAVAAEVLAVLAEREPRSC